VSALMIVNRWLA